MKTIKKLWLSLRLRLSRAKVAAIQNCIVDEELELVGIRKELESLHSFMADEQKRAINLETDLQLS
jgi:hypothetical protein